MRGFKTCRRLLGAGVAFAALSPVAAMADTAAEQASTPESSQKASEPAPGEIVVTAQKRNEVLRDVPVAISAFTSEKRDLLGIDSGQDLARFTPGMELVQSPDRVTIRGVGRAANTLGSDPGVAVYYDGVYDSEATPLVQAPMLVERIEVLRGPQGTLYGRNSIAGAINVISRRPADQLEIEFEQTLGSFEMSRTTGTVSAPLTDGVGFRLSGDYYRPERFIDNLQCDCKVGSERRTYLEGQINFDIGSNANLFLVYGYLKKSGTTIPTVRQVPYDTTTRSIGLTINPTLGYNIPNPGVTDPFTVDSTPEYRTRTEHRVAANLDVDFGWADFTYVGGFKHRKGRFVGDFDESSRVGFTDPVSGAFVSSELLFATREKAKSYSNEINLKSPANGSAFKWIVGLYQSYQSADQLLTVFAPNQPEFSTATIALGDLLDGPPFTIVPNDDSELFKRGGHVTSKSYAAYGQVDIDLTSALSVTAGIRYTHDKKDGSEVGRLVVYSPELAPGVAVQVNDRSRPVAENWDGVTGRLSMNWKPSERSLVYASYGRGYKAGGFDLGAFNAPVRPEYVNSYELGYKADFGTTLSVSVAGFYYDYKDLQLISRVCAGTVVNPCGVTVTSFTNVPKSRSKGLEFEGNWRPVDGIELIASYAYLDATYRDFRNIQNPLNPSGTPLDLSGQQMPLSPHHKFALTPVFTVPTESGTFKLLATYSYTGKQHYDLFDFAPYRVGTAESVDLRASWTDRSERFTITAYVKNLLNERMIDNVALSTISAGNFGRAVQWDLPRTYGLKFLAQF